PTVEHCSRFPIAHTRLASAAREGTRGYRQLARYTICSGATLSSSRRGNAPRVRSPKLPHGKQLANALIAGTVCATLPRGIDVLFQWVGRVVSSLAGSLSGLFLSLGSNFSIASLLSALCIAIAFLVSRRGKKPVKYEVMRRALFPRWLGLASFRAD